RHAPLEQLLILLGARRKASDGEIDARGLVAGELAVVQISLVDDLRNDSHAPVLDSEPLDQRLERAVLAVVPEVGAQDIEWDALPRGVGRIREPEFRLLIVEAPDEPGGRDAIDVRPRPRHPRAAVRGQRRTMSPPGRPRSRLCGPQACGGGLPELSGPRAGWRVQIVDRQDAVQLALAPHPDTVTGWRGRKTHQEHQPAHLALSVTSATLGVNRYAQQLRSGRSPCPQRRPRPARA